MLTSEQGYNSPYFAPAAEPTMVMPWQREFQVTPDEITLVF